MIAIKKLNKISINLGGPVGVDNVLYTVPNGKIAIITDMFITATDFVGITSQGSISFRTLSAYRSKTSYPSRDYGTTQSFSNFSMTLTGQVRNIAFGRCGNSGDVNSFSFGNSLFRQNDRIAIRLGSTFVGIKTMADIDVFGILLDDPTSFTDLPLTGLISALNMNPFRDELSYSTVTTTNPAGYALTAGYQSYQCSAGEVIMTGNYSLASGFSIVFKLYLDATGTFPAGNQNKYILGNSKTGTGFAIGIGTGANDGFIEVGGTRSSGILMGTTINTIYTFAMSYNPATSNVTYYNAGTSSSFTANMGAGSNLPLVIGGEDTPVKVGHVCVYNRVLSNSELSYITTNESHYPVGI